MSTILVVRIPPLSGANLDRLRIGIEKTFQTPVDIGSTRSIDPSPAYNDARGQYFSTQLISSLLRSFPHERGKILGLTSVDLYIPVLTYVFGEAQLAGTAAVLSSFRLDERIYGLPANDDLMNERLLKEAIHELGHTFGLVHCIGPECVMHSSSSAEEVDLKLSRFCPRCSELLRHPGEPESREQGDGNQPRG